MAISNQAGKYFLALGGFLAFTLALIAGYLAGNDAITILRDASIAAVIGALLMKVLLFALELNIRTAQNQKRIKAAQLEELSKKSKS